MNRDNMIFELYRSLHYFLVDSKGKGNLKGVTLDECHKYEMRCFGYV